MTSKFSQRGGAQPTPKICKAVGDSFRFVETPMKRTMQWSTAGDLATSIFSWQVNGTSTLHQIGNPIFQWSGTIGDPLGDNAFVHLFYDDIARILTIHYFARQGIITLLTRVKIVLNIDASQPLGTNNILFTRDSDPGTIHGQFLF